MKNMTKNKWKSRQKAKESQSIKPVTRITLSLKLYDTSPMAQVLPLMSLLIVVSVVAERNSL